MIRTFKATGYKPFNNRLDEFMRACDLGIDSVMVPFTYVVRLTVDDNSTPEQLDAQENVVRQAFEAQGYVSVRLSEAVPPARLRDMAADKDDAPGRRER